MNVYEAIQEYFILQIQRFLISTNYNVGKMEIVFNRNTLLHPSYLLTFGSVHRKSGEHEKMSNLSTGKLINSRYIWNYVSDNRINNE